ncbi:hypothetical protein [Actinomadura sp. CNU-125]|uniref:hypothetical protein n=1 Tax=Actinomadura sp. CNU-125 TaxID=1904961 RepID=UPI00130161E3|nr:hypothetical protein [Actinomadura sp. CNU-125]
MLYVGGQNFRRNRLRALDATGSRACGSTADALNAKISAERGNDDDGTASAPVPVP